MKKTIAFILSTVFVFCFTQLEAAAVETDEEYYSELLDSAIDRETAEKLEEIGLYDFSADEILSSLRHDKKAKGDGVNVVFVNEIGSFEFRYLTFNELEKTVKEAYLK
jgi:3-dehydroquinate synthetase